MGWSDKYKKSIDCNNPKGFSQKAHCAGRKIRKENMKLSELKNIIKNLIQERSVNAISKAQQKNASDIEKALDFYKKNKNTDKAKAFIKVLKKLGEDKKKLEKEMDDKISSLYKNADYKGPIDEKARLSQIHKAAKKGSYPVTIVATMLGKVVKQELVKTPQAVPAAFMMMQGGYPRASVAVEDKTGKILFSDNPIKEETLNEGPSREEFRIAAMAIRKQAKFRNVSAEQAIQDQLNALKLLQRYIKKGDVKKYTGMNLSESIELGKVYPNPYATAFKPQENSLNEMQVVNKKTGKDITRYVLDLLSGKIDKKKFEKLTGLKKESVNEEDDHEVGMGLSSLKSSVRSAKVIYDNIKKRNIEELDGWVQEKLTLASDYLKNVADYMEDLDEYDKDGTSNN